MYLHRPRESLQLYSTRYPPPKNIGFLARSYSPFVITIHCGRYAYPSRLSLPMPPAYTNLTKLLCCTSKLVYQTTVFFSRSSISVGLPPLPLRLLSLPAILQSLILVTLAFESAVGFFPVESSGTSIVVVFLLVSLEGICGGLA